MKDSVELCQRFGRARQEIRAIVVLDERHDRPVELLEMVKAKQENIVQNFDLNKVEKDEEIERSKQKQLESKAYRTTLLKKDWSNPVQALNEYEQKTKGNLDCTCHPRDNGFHCKITYKSILRTLDTSVHWGTTKKEAKALAALEALTHLEEATRDLYF